MEFYKCVLCGNVITKVVDTGPCLTCCSKEMLKLEANSVDADKDKHIPIVNYENGFLQVTVGKIIHPMILEHHIAFICIEYGDRYQFINLHIGNIPTATFALGDYHGLVKVYEYCNLHGLWENDVFI